MIKLYEQERDKRMKNQMKQKKKMKQIRHLLKRRNKRVKKNIATFVNRHVFTNFEWKN